MTQLDNDAIEDAVQVVREAVFDARNSGQLRTFIGLHGHVTLLHDRLQRWFGEKDEGRKLDELLGLAVDGLVAFAMACPETPKVDRAAVANQLRQEHLMRQQAIARMTGDADEAREVQ